MTQRSTWYMRGDIVYGFDYKRKADVLQLEANPTSSFKVSFTIVDAKTLARTDTGDPWKKVDLKEYIKKDNFNLRLKQ